MRIGVDVDGVLADFNKAFIAEVVRVTGKDLFPPRPFEIPTWDYPQHYGYTNEETRDVWADIKANPDFWRDLPGYQTTIGAVHKLKLLSVYHDVYFVTNRMGMYPKQQTEAWLRRQLSYSSNWHPTVLISADKGGMASALKLEQYVDDKWENALDVALQTKGACETYLLDQPWNRGKSFTGIRRIDTIEEFIPTITSKD